MSDKTVKAAANKASDNAPIFSDKTWQTKLFDEIYEAINKGGESYDFDKTDAAFEVMNVIKRKEKAAVSTYMLELAKRMQITPLSSHWDQAHALLKEMFPPEP